MELSTNPRYMDEFVAACFLPHTNRELFPSSVQSDPGRALRMQRRFRALSPVKMWFF